MKKNKKKSNVQGKVLMVYYDKDKKGVHIVRPTKDFKGDWRGLAFAVTNGNFHSFKVV